MHYNLSGMLRVAFVLLLIRFTLATFQLRMPRSQLQLLSLFVSLSLFLYLARSFISLTIAALCLFWRLLHSFCTSLSPRMQHVAHRQQLPPQHPVLRLAPAPPPRHSSSPWSCCDCLFFSCFSFSVSSSYFQQLHFLHFRFVCH